MYSKEEKSEGKGPALVKQWPRGCRERTRLAHFERTTNFSGRMDAPSSPLLTLNHPQILLTQIRGVHTTIALSFRFVDTGTTVVSRSKSRHPNNTTRLAPANASSTTDTQTSFASGLMASGRTATNKRDVSAFPRGHHFATCIIWSQK